MAAEKFCLQWNDFQQNIATSFGELRSVPEFSDVTLVCEDQHIEAHRIILTACSPFFRSMLNKSKHSHPLIYMSKVNAKDLTSILDFIYFGEASIFEEDLDGFLSLAEELQLKGLTGTSGVLDDDQTKTSKINPPKRSIYMKEEIKTKFEDVSQGHDDLSIHQSYDHGTMIEGAIVPNETEKSLVPVGSNNEDVKLKIDTMMERIYDGPNRWKCSVCGKTTRDKTNMAQHIESHIEGVSYPCNLCEKISRSASALAKHISSYHKKL